MVKGLRSCLALHAMDPSSIRINTWSSEYHQGALLSTVQSRAPSHTSYPTPALLVVFQQNKFLRQRLGRAIKELEPMHKVLGMLACSCFPHPHLLR